MKNPPLVWYASYGSNVNAERFNCYIAGGIPVGGTRDYGGCTDKTLPIKSVGLELPQSLYFAGESKVWTGGLAFISIESGGKPTKARAYLVTLEQFEEIVMQESWREEVNRVDLDELKQFGHLTLGDGTGNYDELVYCGERDGYPIVSFTNPRAVRPFAKPVPSYLRMIGTGLIEVHKMKPRTVAKYLIAAPGITGNYSLKELEDIFLL